MAIAEASIAAALEALSTGCSPAAAAIAADASASKAEEKSQAGAGDEGVDEFGRSLRLMRQSEAEGRAAMRKARWKHAKEGGRNCDFDLEASSDESDGEVCTCLSSSKHSIKANLLEQYKICYLWFLNLVCGVRSLALLAPHSLSRNEDMFIN